MPYKNFFEPLIGEFMLDFGGTVGHPTKRGNDKSFHYINRSSVKKSGFELASYYPKSGQISKFEKIDILNCIKVVQIQPIFPLDLNQ